MYKETGMLGMFVNAVDYRPPLRKRLKRHGEKGGEWLSPSKQKASLLSLSASNATNNRMDFKALKGA